jgi:hypothetical protein
LHKISDLVRFASDASPYRFVPQAVIVADGIDDIAKIFDSPTITAATLFSGRAGRR